MHVAHHLDSRMHLKFLISYGNETRMSVLVIPSGKDALFSSTKKVNDYTHACN